MLFMFSNVYACAQFLKVAVWDKIPNKKSMQSDKCESCASRKIKRDGLTSASLLLISSLFLFMHPAHIFYLNLG